METFSLKPISSVDKVRMQQKLDQLAKPIAGLGRLEYLATTIAGIQHQVNLSTSQRCCLVFAADHGVAVEGVSATPQKVTAIQSINMLNGHTAASAIAKSVGCDLQVIDVGLCSPLSDKRLINHKIRFGTRDMVENPAMTLREAREAIDIGYNVAQQAINRGNDLLLLGELGIANTTSASAILCARYDVSPDKMVGHGSNISSQRYRHKIDVVTKALDKWYPKANDAIDILHAVGGYEIGAKVGAMIKAAECGVPMILDGFISYAALSLAELLAPGIKDHVILGHASKENGTNLAIKCMQINPVLDLNLAVGEGTGALLVLPLIDAIQSVLKNMNTQKDMQFGFHP